MADKYGIPTGAKEAAAALEEACDLLLIAAAALREQGCDIDSAVATMLENTIGNPVCNVRQFLETLAAQQKAAA